METTAMPPFYNGGNILFTFYNGLKRTLEPLKLPEFDLERNKDKETLMHISSINLI